MFMTFLQAVPATTAESPVRSLLDQLMTFIYSAAHWSGTLVARLIDAIVGYTLPQNLIDPLGFLILVTVFLAVAEFAKRLAWFVVVIGWALIILRIVLEVLNVTPTS